MGLKCEYQNTCKLLDADGYGKCKHYVITDFEDWCTESDIMKSNFPPDEEKLYYEKSNFRNQTSRKNLD